jgi:probable HAF family extracellular repeat protein
MFAMVVFGGVKTALASPVYSFTTIDVPGGFDTRAMGINYSGQIVGAFDAATGTHGFLYTGGSFTVIGATLNGAPANGINDSGQIVGSFADASGTPIHGFLYTGGSFTTIDVPGAVFTYAYGINGSGQIVGFYQSTGFPPPLHGFLDKGGSFTTIDVPGAVNTYVQGINNSGQIVGYFVGAGFPPASWLLVFGRQLHHYRCPRV